MTEAEWMACEDSRLMLEFIQRGIVVLVDELPTPAAREATRRFLASNAFDRKMTLFACACGRFIWPLFTDERSRRAVETAERFIDGLANEEERAEAQRKSLTARDACGQSRRGKDGVSAHIARVAAHVAYEISGFSVSVAAHESADVATWARIVASLSDARAYQATLLRCIIGNPFRPVSSGPWTSRPP
jgi:hypothetical protein